MRNWLFNSGRLLAGTVLAGIGLATPSFLNSQSLPAQQPLFASPAPTPKVHRHAHDGPAGAPSVEPAFTIPVTPLGFAAPAPFYLGNRVAQASLDFLDEGHLLFTFRVPGLIPRDSIASGQSVESVRQVRAFVLALPTGQVTAEALWTLHDLSPYLWMLKDGRFLLRNWNLVEIGDSSLHLDPFLRFPGPVNSLELDPTQHLLIANSSEPAAPSVNIASTAGPDSSILSTPAKLDPSQPSPSRQSVIRILSMDTRTVQLFSHVSGAVHLPVDTDGYFEPLRGKGANWVISHQNFRSGSTTLWQLDSSCFPNLDTPAPGIVLATVCVPSGSRKLVAVGPSKHPLWEQVQPNNRVWPRIVTASNALRIARSTLELSHSLDATSPLAAEDIRGQVVQVFDLADGKLQLTVPANPILDGGGNFALSPSGQRFALLHAGVIEVFELPPPPPLPSAEPAPAPPTNETNAPPAPAPAQPPVTAPQPNHHGSL